ncbi:AfsR/SARP family transcriptional regulator [Micromonospora narathiwatensis]|uniref:DNA-binding transcriptional activator of the SARP family n=1 Tax=Micromonospora narathiwatensis TaxID=299146 RepID=A0A1A9AFT8_9ACTN|nr:tetratricopeptide repeat protein [Micromonospora narathiwatensis]SBT55002.1 DNA-binding transcriptional activator of the SARP family [Micromonospora narathiwatensis]
MLRIGVLGPVRVTLGQRPVRLGPKLVELLAILLVEAGSAVPASRVVELLWGTTPPPGARATLRSHVSHLRRALGDADGPVVVTVGSGASAAYRLDVPADSVDHRRFERWCAEGRRLLDTGEPDLTERAAALLDRALALWRGPAFADVADRSFVLPEVARLDATRRTARRGYAEALSALGRHAEAIAQLSGALVDDPYDEAVRRLLALALYAEQRVDEAAEVCREGLVLLQERGLDAPELHELQRDILHRRLPPRPPPADRGKPLRPCLLPPDPPQFVGRADDLAQGRKLLRSAPDGSPVVLVGGPAGVGKTLFAVRLAHTVLDDFPDGQLFVTMRGFDPTGTPVTAGEALRGFLDALGVPPDRVPATIEAQAGLYRSLLADRRVLVVLDNVRDAEQVRPLLPGAAGCAAVVVSRNQLSNLVVAEGARPLRLAPLPTHECRELMARRLGATRLAGEPAAVEAIIDACGRLPLALAIVAARAAAHPEFTLAALAAELPPGGGLDAFTGGDTTTDVRAVFSWSYHGLTRGAARLFRLLAAHPGPDFAVAAVASLAGQAADEVRPALRELAAAHLVVEHVPGRLLLHDLLRMYAAELGRDDPELPAARQRAVEHYLAAALAADRLLWPHRDPLEVPPVAAGVAVEGFADQPAALAWFDAEHAALLAGLEQAARHGLDRYVWPLAWASTNFFARRGHWSDWVRAGQAGVAAARRQGDRAAEAEAHRTVGGAYVRLHRFDAAREHYRQALELFAGLDDLVGQGFTHRSLGWLYEQRGDIGEALRQDRRALELFQRAGHERGVASTLNSVGWCHALLGEHEQAIVHCRRSLTLLERVGDPVGMAGAWDSLGYAYRHLDIEQAIACYREALALYERLGDRPNEAITLRYLGETQHASGDRAAARRSWRRSLDILTEIEHPDAARVRALLTEEL